MSILGKLFFFFPACYFFKTRLNAKPAILFHGYAEYLLAILIMIYAGIPLVDSIQHFLLSYFAFISIYEIGYIVNDYVSVKYEKSPRKRLGDYEPPKLVVIGWVALRVVCFLVLTYVLNLAGNLVWWLFYVLLAFSFGLHNIIKNKGNKIFTFVSLAFFRFYAPIFIILPKQFLISSIPSIFICYIFYRTLTYIASKGLLSIPNRNTFQFKRDFYLYFIPLSVILCFFLNDSFSLYINVYFLIFWEMLFILHSAGYIKLTEKSM